MHVQSWSRETPICGPLEKRASLALMRHTDPGTLAPRGISPLMGLGLAALLAACGNDGNMTSFGSATETGPGPTSDAPTTGTTGTSAPTTDATTTTTGDDTTMSALTTSGDSTSTGLSSTGDGSSSTGPALCPEDTIECDGTTAKTCDGLGGFKNEEACPEACVPEVGCKPCVPGSFQCVDTMSQKCSEDYVWVDWEVCDAVQGLSCDMGSGECAGACSKKELGESYIGCEYYAASLANLHETQPWLFHYALVVANTTEAKADVTVTRNDMQIQKIQVGPGTAKVIALPYVDELTKPTIGENGPSVLVAAGAYHVRSTLPVTVYQYEPLEYVVPGNLYSYTNDASLLLPTHIWTGSYMVASRNHYVTPASSHLPGFYAVIARDDETTVTITPGALGASVYAGGGVAADGTGEVKLNRGDVLEVFTKSNGMTPNADLTGTRIDSDKPISVFGGHKCTQVPLGTVACDRLEEAMPPIETLASKYIVTPALIPTGGDVPKAHLVRIIATADATELTYDPPQNGAPTMIAKAGEYVEMGPTAADFEITGSKKILVSQYMLGQGNDQSSSGDPAMALAVATEQFRDSYLVHAPLSYETNYANLVAPADAAITLDGNPVAGFVPIGMTGFSVARVPLANNVDGNHVLAGDKPFGVTVYGYGKYTSYWYPGGLDLKLIPG
jgi:hypothetical protein